MATYNAYFSFLLDFPCPTVHILKPKTGALISGPLLELLHLQTLHIEILYFLHFPNIKFLLCAVDNSKCQGCGGRWGRYGP